MGAWNFFRLAGDFCHLASKIILLLSIHRNRSAEGVSFITQVLYCVVFLARYTDLFGAAQYLYNRIFKIFYILSSFYIIAAMQWMFPRTRERELAWKLGAACFFGSLLLSPFTMLIFQNKGEWSFFWWLWNLSYILESVCVLPQLLLLRQTTVPTVIDSYYLLALGLYRAFYILNWFIRELDMSDSDPKPVKVIFGLLQTALYVDFAWVYYTRQRVKLRSGGVVDADDMRKSWLLRRIFGNHVDRDAAGGRAEDDEEGGPALGGGGRGGRNGNAGRGAWGKRGISVSADDGVLGGEGRPFMEDDEDEEEHGITDVDAPDAKMRDPDELAMALDDDEDETGGSSSSAAAVPSGVKGGDEWRD
ncbi:putative ER lumen protein retaining receptor [Cryphonectria parasitica EP155]|uniref:ER lumen protein retaining receptor n=1 Tax=Cryphonectria parasitica (strain ATCC 38755 / EP155) TaxID=660469 RepID=A0A9P4Y151_CRYP1|nr:putative ER lumen protein retaining receptor [Cryphonectria parasitica EP155]KAF3764472.1 putative ER lumen protein retaining receptor [Cryphonectria parasitica EP155]